MACPPNINPWLCEKLKQMGVIKDPPGSPSGPTLSLLIQIEPRAANNIIAALRRMGLSPSQPFFFNQFIEVSAPSGAGTCNCPDTWRGEGKLQHASRDSERERLLRYPSLSSPPPVASEPSSLNISPGG
jgi:hypothetical protein